MNNLNTGARIGEDSTGGIPSNIRTHALEDFSDGKFLLNLVLFNLD